VNAETVPPGDPWYISSQTPPACARPGITARQVEK